MFSNKTYAVKTMNEEHSAGMMLTLPSGGHRVVFLPVHNDWLVIAQVDHFPGSPFLILLPPGALRRVGDGGHCSGAQREPEAWGDAGH